jgi:preprotein translocase subunit SecG
MLLGKSKERGAEKFITNLTYALGFAFIIISFILSL